MLFSKETYLDYASASSGNPSSLHTVGKKLQNDLTKIRVHFARTLCAQSDEIILTSSSSSSIGLAIIGFVFNYIQENKNRPKPHIVTTSIEHSAILESCVLLESLGLALVSYVVPGEFGIINPKDIEHACNENTLLITMGLVNSELGSIQDIKSIIAMLNRINKNNQQKIILHLDATQAAVHMDISEYVKKGVELISFNAVKMGGPAGVGMLYKKRNIKPGLALKLSPIYGGGSQEFGLWPGTQNIDLVKSFYKAYVHNLKEIKTHDIKYKQLNHMMVSEFKQLCRVYNIDFKINTDEECAKTLPSFFSFSLKPFSGEQIMIELSSRGAHVSSKSACNTKDNTESYVVSAVRKVDNFDYSDGLWGTVRVSFGPKTTKRDVRLLIKALNDIFKTYKNMLY